MHSLVPKFARFMSITVLVIAVLAAGPLLRVVFDSTALAQDWRTASTDPVGWAPSPADYQPAVVQVYAARTVRWRGSFGDHTWIAAKAPGASTYTRYEVIGFYVARGRSAVSVTEITNPDRRWYGAAPLLLQDIRGVDAEKIIAALPAAVASYPHADSYTVWPGPNSNTFVAHVARQIPDLNLVMPGRAIGKDYLMGGRFVGAAPSGTGFQVSLGGLLGVMFAAEEGFELNVLGLVVGASPMHLSVTVPGFGRFPAREDWTGGRHAAPPTQVSEAPDP